MRLIINTGLAWLDIRKRSIHDIIVKGIGKINLTGLVPLHCVIFIFCISYSRNFMYARNGDIVRSIVLPYPLRPVGIDIRNKSIIWNSPEAYDLWRKLVFEVIEVLQSQF